MPTSLEKLQGNKSATPIEIMETDHENLHLSRDAFEIKYRKKAEIKAKLAAEKARLEAEADKEQAALENIGSQDTVETVKQEEE